MKPETWCYTRQSRMYHNTPDYGIGIVINMTDMTNRVLGYTTQAVLTMTDGVDAYEGGRFDKAQHDGHHKSYGLGCH